MAAALLLLLLVSACTAELGFQPKRQYTYLYEAKQASGIPGLQSQWSALGLKMKVTIQVPTTGNLYFKLEYPQQGELKNVHTHQPWRKYFSMPYSPVQQHQEELSRVFKVQLNGGVISKVITTQGEPVWVVNIKKSIAQLFQMDMQKHQAIEVPSMAQPRSYQSDQQEEFFRVMEDSIGGECETLYETTPRLPQNIKADVLQELSVLSQSSHRGIQVPEFDHFQPFVVTKTKNYQNCKSRPNWQHMTPGAVSCRSDDCYLTSSNRSASARYVLDGDRSSFKIQYVVAESEALMFPYGHETEQLWTVTNQTLFLQQDKSMGSFFGEPQRPKSHEKLEFQYPTTDGQELRTPDLKSAPQLSVHLPGAPVQLIQKQQTPQQLITIIKQAIQRVDQLLNHVPEPVQEDVTGYLVEVERALSWLSYEQLEQVYSGLQSQAQKDIYWDALVMSGTNPAVMKIVDGISSNKIKEARIAPILATLPINIKTPTYQLIGELWKLYKSPVIQSQKLQRMTMALSLGNIFYQVCVSNTTVDHSYTQGLYQQHFCSSQTNALLKEQFIPFLESKISETQEPEKLAYIQALGNTGDHRIILALKQIAEHQNEPLVASKAIYALYRVAAQYPQEVQKTVLPIFHDVSRPIEVRSAAITMLLATNPPIAYWQKIATSTWYEPSDTMVALIHSTYSTMANISMAQVQPIFEMSRRARNTLPLVRPPQGGFGLSGSFNYRSGLIIPEYQLAAFTKFSVIASKTSIIPSTIYMELQQYINSILYSKNRLSLDVKGGQKIIDDIMGVGSAWSPRRQSPRDLRSQFQQLDSTLQSLKSEKLQATLYTQLWGAIDAFLAFDDESYNTMVQKIRQDGSWSATQLQKIAYIEDTTVTIPSEIGMPVIYSKKMPMVASVRGQMGVKWSLNGGQYHAVLQKVQPFVAVKSLITVSTVSPFSLRMLGAGVENNVQVSLPMSLKLELDIQAKKLQVELETVQQPSPVTIAHVRTYPFTTAVKVIAYDNTVTSPDTKEITTARKTDIEVPLFKDLGVEGYLRMVSDDPIINFGTFWAQMKKQGTAGLKNVFMMGSLRSRHFDIVIDTARSNLQKFQATFGIVSQDTQDKPMRQPIIANQQHASQVSSIIQNTRSQMPQQSPWKRSQLSPQQKQRLAIEKKTGYVAVATITQRTGSQQHYDAKLLLSSDAQRYAQDLVFQAQSPSQKVSLNASLDLPVLTDNRLKLLQQERVEASVSARLAYGSYYQHVLDMEGYVKRDQVAAQYAQSCPEAQRCIEHEARGNPNSADCRLAKNHAALANYYELHLSDKGLTQGFRKAAYGLEKLVEYMLWPYMSSDPFVQNPNNKVLIKMQLNPFKNGMTLNISTPSEDVKFTDMPLPVNMLYEPALPTMRKSIQKKIVDSIYGVDKTACLVDKRVVKTFDNVTIERQPSDCWTLLANDTSAIRNISIYEKVVNQQSVARVWVEGKKIEIDGSALGQVKIDDQVKSLSRPVIVRDSASKTLAQILQLTDDMVKVQLPQHYAQVLVTKEGIQIGASLMAYRNRLRGLCGDFDGEGQDDLVGPQECIYKQGQAFYEAYWSQVDNPPKCRPHQQRCVPRQLAQTSQSQGYYQGVRSY